MTRPIVSRFGVEADCASVDLVDLVIDATVSGTALQAHGTDTYALADAMQRRLVHRCSDGSLAVMIRGAVLSTWWPVLGESVKDYWRNLLSSIRERDRGAIVLYKRAGFSSDADWMLLRRLVWTHQWFGADYDVSAPDEIRVSVPHYVRRCSAYGGRVDEMLVEVPELWRVVARSLPSAPTQVRRSHPEMRRDEREALRETVEAELGQRIVVGRGTPAWLCRVIEDYLDEGDLALRAGAIFAAAVLYGAAGEAVLAPKYGSHPLPVGRPDLVPPSELHETFKISKLLQRADADLQKTPALHQSVHRLRAIRNGIHGNMYIQASTLLSVGEAVEVRRTVRALALWAA